MKIWEFGRTYVFSNNFFLVMADLKRILEALRKKCTFYHMPLHARAPCNQIFTPTSTKLWRKGKTSHKKIGYVHDQTRDTEAVRQQRDLMCTQGKIFY